MDYTVKQITYDEAVPWLLKIHYAKRIPHIAFPFGLFDSDNYLVGVCTFGNTASNELCIGVCGEENKDFVIELNRLVLKPNLPKNTASFFISKCFKFLPKPRIIISFADTSKNHHGYVYQATNWIYTGLSAKRKDWLMIGTNRHSRPIHGSMSADELRSDGRFELVDRARKHRYIYFHGCSKKIKENLKYKIEPYPKGDNKRYDIDETKIVSVGALF